jgi:hypothetical protein
MAYGKSYDQDYGDENKLAWDLRQFYARYVSSYIINFKIAEDKNDYPTMLKTLCRWHSAAKHEWSDDKVDEEFEKLKMDLYSVANKYRTTYFGKTFDSHEVEQIEDALQKIKEYLIFKMKQSNMFGSVWDDEGL